MPVFELETLSDEKMTVGKVKKIHSQWGKIHGTINIPHNTLVFMAKKELEKFFFGDVRVNPKYAKEVLIVLDYAKNHCHYLTNNSMLEDILSNKRIYFNSYSIVHS